MQRLCDKYNRAIDSIHQLVSLYVWRFSCAMNVKIVEMNNTVTV